MSWALYPAKLGENKMRWKTRGERMTEGRTPKEVIQYELRGKQDIGRPLKRF